MKKCYQIHLNFWMLEKNIQWTFWKQFSKRQFLIISFFKWCFFNKIIFNSLNIYIKKIFLYFLKHLLYSQLKYYKKYKKIVIYFLYKFLKNIFYLKFIKGFQKIFLKTVYKLWVYFYKILLKKRWMKISRENDK